MVVARDPALMQRSRERILGADRVPNLELWLPMMNNVVKISLPVNFEIANDRQCSQQFDGIAASMRSG